MDGLTRREFFKYFGSAIAAMSFLSAHGALFDFLRAASKSHIRFSTWHTPTSREVKTVWEPMLEELRRRSKGEIDYTVFSGGALGKGPEHFDIVAKGLSDMGYFTATWTPGRFPLSDVLSLAVWIDGKEISTDIGNAVYEKVLRAEFQGVKVIELNGCIQSFIWTKRRPIRRMADLKGLKLRTPGGHQTGYIKALGAEPIFMPIADVYMALETGTIDGLVTCPPILLAFKLNEVVRFGTILTFGCVTEGVVMNERAWFGLPESHRRIIEEVCKNPFRTTGGLTRVAYKEMMKEIEDSGVKLEELPSSEAQAWYKAFQDVTMKWVEELERKGLPAKRAVKVFNEECEKRHIRCVAYPPELEKA